MPPKAKLHKNTSIKSVSSKSSPFVPTNNNRSEESTNSGTTVTSSSSASILSPEQEQQFELQLCWCIQQLQNALKSEKLNSKQIHGHTKSLNTLMSNSAPIIKKRQVMRVCFGDYRAKMAEEAKKASKKLSIKVIPASPSNKSVFIKKAILTSSDNSFKFNFPAMETSEDTEITNDHNRSNIECMNVNSNKAAFSKSDNAFRFNFIPGDTDNEQ